MEEGTHPEEEEDTGPEGTGPEGTGPEEDSGREEEDSDREEEEEGNGLEEEAGTSELCITGNTQDHRLPIG